MCKPEDLRLGPFSICPKRECFRHQDQGVVRYFPCSFISLDYFLFQFRWFFLLSDFSIQSSYQLRGFNQSNHVSQIDLASLSPFLKQKMKCKFCRLDNGDVSIFIRPLAGSDESRAKNLYV